MPPWRAFADGGTRVGRKRIQKSSQFGRRHRCMVTGDRSHYPPLRPQRLGQLFHQRLAHSVNGSHFSSPQFKLFRRLVDK